MNKLILPNQQNAPPSGQIACEANGEIVFMAIMYQGLGHLGAALDVEGARDVANRLLSEADKASTVRFQNRLAAASLEAAG
jgi:hypothetical protein